MTYRIKVPPRTLPVGEEQLVSGLEHWLIGLKTYRWSLIVGFVLLLLMGMGLWGLFWYEEQNASKAQELEREATLLLFTRTSNDPQKQPPISMRLLHCISEYLMSIHAPRPPLLYSSA